MRRPRPRILVILLVALVVAAAAAAFWLLRPAPAPRLTLRQARFEAVEGWRHDRLSAALPALLKSCAAILSKGDDAPLDAIRRAADFGRVGDWRVPCAGAARVPRGDDAAARQFFEAAFVPLLAGNNGAEEGLFTGYFEIAVDAARQRGGRYQTPIYRLPPEPGRYARAEIEDGALAGQGLELFWLDDPIDAFFLEIQGSGVVRLADGGRTRVGYAGKNGRRYVAIGRLLVERGIMRKEQVTMASLRRWMKDNPRQGAALRRENPSYVFFREIAGAGPIGAEQVVLTPERSLAVDRRFIAFGVPIWLDARQRFGSGTIRRLLVAQDTGGAIRGPVRGDIYWGSGDKAGAQAGATNALGRYYLLLPRAVADRMEAAAAH